MCKSAPSGKPYLSQLVPLVALVREQRFAPAHAGDAFLSEAVPSTDRNALRKTLRARRRSVSASERSRAAQLVARNADRHLHLEEGWRIAIYLSLPSELDTAPLIALARQRGCEVFVPRIERHSLGRRMRFIELTGPQRRNRLGIHEPVGSRSIGARWLDVVFLPLVGFDACGVRLGMGGGYYDRAFAFRRWRTTWHTPRLIGLSYAFQQVESLQAAPHDVRLDAVVTEERIVQCAIG